MASVKCLHFSMQDEDILEHANTKCHSYLSALHGWYLVLK